MSIAIAREYGFERIVDHFSRLVGDVKEGFSARVVRRMCNVGNWTQPLPSVEFVSAFFDRFDKGEFHDANLFKLIMRILTSSKKIRRDQERVLLRRLRTASRNGSLRLSDYARRRRWLLRMLLFKARLVAGSTETGKEGCR